MKTLGPYLAALIAALALVSCGAPPEQNENQGHGLDDTFDTATLLVEANDGATHTFTIYLALNTEQQRRGLMFVRSMPANVGMLFVYEDDAMHSMWMKNTYLPLDMIFARRDGSVSSVIHDTQALSLTSQASVEPVAYVLELNAGTARRLNIGSKSRINWESGKQNVE